MYYEVMTTEKCESDIFKDSDLAAELLGSIIEAC